MLKVDFVRILFETDQHISHRTQDQCYKPGAGKDPEGSVHQPVKPAIPPVLHGVLFLYEFGQVKGFLHPEFPDDFPPVRVYRMLAQADACSYFAGCFTLHHAG
jgi:hypothetical protein